MARPKFSYKEYSESLEATVAGLRKKNAQLRAELKALKEPVKLETRLRYRVYGQDRERGRFPEDWHKDFDTHREAMAFYEEVNAKNTEDIVPEFYSQATLIDKVEVSV